MKITIELTPHQVHIIVRDAIISGFPIKPGPADWMKDETTAAIQYLINHVWDPEPKKEQQL